MSTLDSAKKLNYFSLVVLKLFQKCPQPLYCEMDNREVKVLKTLKQFVRRKTGNHIRYTNIFMLRVRFIFYAD